MIENEQRFKVLDESKIREVLKQHATFVDSVRQLDIAFEISEKEIIRVRIENNTRVILEHKKMIEQHKWEETKVLVYPKYVRNLIKILYTLIPNIKILEKQREMWKIDDFLICLDNVKYLGKFLEIEGQNIEKVKRLFSGTIDETPQEPYGWMLKKLMDEGKITFRIEDIFSAPLV